MAWPEVARAVEGGCTTVILPLGATEQHGPHLPLATDTLRAEALAKRLTERLPDALVAPPLPYGCSDEHTGFPGLLGLEKETLARVVLDLARRLRDWGATRLVLLSAHGGNREALALALELLAKELPELDVSMNDNFESIPEALIEIASKDGLSPTELGLHAGESETSEMLHLRPDLVRSGLGEPGFTGDMEAVVDRLRSDGLRAATENGVLGDPRRANAVRGARYLDAAVERFAGELEAGRA